MGCSHASGCPLFPKLNASLRGWRDAYCDSDVGWRHCARYAKSLSGQSVPLTLLPNGKYAHTISRPTATDLGRFESVPAARPAAPDSPFETAAPAAAPSAPATAALPSGWATVAEPAAPVAALAEPDGATVAVAPAAPPPARRNGWWARLVTWMRGPA